MQSAHAARSVSAFSQHARIRFLDHLLAKIDADQVVLKDIVVEHVLGGFAEIDDPFANVASFTSVSHVLRINRAGRMVIAADSANSAGDEMSIARILIPS